MTERGRGLYNDPSGARAVLDAIGGSYAPLRTDAGAPPEPMRGVYRGRCGNRMRAPAYVGHGLSRVMVDPGYDGCSNEVAADAGHLKLCVECYVRYRSAGTAVRVERARDLSDRMPGLCNHGQRAHECGACIKKRA